MLCDQGDGVNLEAEALPGLLEHLDVPCGLLAEREVLPDHHLGDVQPLDQQFMHIALG